MRNAPARLDPAAPCRRLRGLGALLLSLLPVLVAAAEHAAAVPSNSVASLAREAAARVAPTQGRLRARGLHRPVTVRRDTWGVPHIYATDTHDLFFAQGYVVAQDRLFQMELWKRSGQGRLAEVLGPQSVQRDIGARLLRYRGDMDAEYRSYAPDAREILAAFTAGINAWIDRVNADGERALPLEFILAGFRPEHWRPEDCLNRLAAFSMMGNAGSELFHAQLVARLGPERSTPLLRLEPAVRLDPAPGLDYAGLAPEQLAHIVSSDQRMSVPGTLPHESNNWTISGRLTRSGHPLLANDPHRVIALPSLRYVVHLQAPGWNVIGAGEPALPGVAVGHNEHIAWGFTIFGLDQEDLYLEQLDPTDPLRYRTPEGWAHMREVQETLQVRGAAAVPVRLHFTVHGPVLWEDGRRALALRWVGAEPGSAGYLGSLTLDRARNWDEFEAAMPRWKVPSENIVFADRAGNIGEHSTGLAPLRRGFTGLVPLPADGQHEWSGWVGNAELPHVLNPPGGFVATANQRMIPDGYPYPVGYEWAEPLRFERIREVLEAAREGGHRLGLEDMRALQADVVSLSARQLLAMLRALDAASLASAAPAATAARALLIGWDGALRSDSAAAALFEAWAPRLGEAVALEVVPPEGRTLLPRLSAYDVVAWLSGPAAPASPASAQRGQLLLGTLARAWDELARQLGPDPAHWSWGQLHTVRLRHPLDGEPALAALFDRGPLPRSGDGEVVQATGFEGGSFAQGSGASYREIFDLADWDAALAINVPGQSGQPGSRHYDDLLTMWAEGRYFPLKFTRAAVESVTAGTLELLP